jgi:hypothetical protein
MNEEDGIGHIPVAQRDTQAQADVLVLCTANVYRSPMAAALLARRLATLGVTTPVHSAGMLRYGDPPHHGEWTGPRPPGEPLSRWSSAGTGRDLADQRVAGPLIGLPWPEHVFGQILARAQPSEDDAHITVSAGDQPSANHPQVPFGGQPSRRRQRAVSYTRSAITEQSRVLRQQNLLRVAINKIVDGNPGSTPPHGLRSGFARFGTPFDRPEPGG